MKPQDRLKEGIRTTAFAFRGYNVTNLGRTPELLAHPSYGPTVSAVLGEASKTCTEVLGRPVDLLARIRSAQETTDLTTYAEDVALMRRVVGPSMGVKAAGGIRSHADAQKMIAAGASRIGASASVRILQEAAK